MAQIEVELQAVPGLPVQVRLVVGELVALLDGDGAVSLGLNLIQMGTIAQCQNAEPSTPASSLIVPG